MARYNNYYLVYYQYDLKDAGIDVLKYSYILRPVRYQSSLPTDQQLTNIGNGSSENIIFEFGVLLRFDKFWTRLFP